MLRALSAGMGALIGVTGAVAVVTTVAPVIHNIVTVLGGVR